MFVSDTNQRFAWCQCLIALLFSAVAWAQETPFDRSVASVDGKVVTLSQLELETRILLVMAGGTEAAFATLTHDDLQRGLEVAVDHRVATLEADKLDAYQLEPGELDHAVSQFRDALGGEPAFRRFLETYDVTATDVADVIRRSMRASKVLDGRLRLKAQVTEAEARRHQAEHPKLRTATVSQVRELLFTQRFRALIAQYVKQARKAADVRFLGPFAPGAAKE
ncbi:MAG: hypothetical protein JNG84_05650 [Archangium sp.]|nr:hypothetical protein [Archangium sp.]